MPGKTRTLYVLRHAKSSWGDESLPDIERPLAERGIRDAKKLGERLRRDKVSPALVLCSPAQRTRETLELVGAGLRPKPEVRYEAELYGAWLETLLELLGRIDAKVASAMVIGHNPVLQELALYLAAPGELRAQLELKFPTLALAVIELPGWSDLGESCGTLRDYVTPKR